MSRPPHPPIAAVALLAALTAATGGCSGARLSKVERSVGELHDEISELRRGQAAQRVQFDEFRNRLVMLQDQLDSQRVRAARAHAVNADAARADEPPPLPRVVLPARPRGTSAAPAATPLPGPLADPGRPPRSVVIGPDGVVHVRRANDGERKNKKTATTKTARTPKGRRAPDRSRPMVSRRAVPAGPGGGAAHPPRNQSPAPAAAGAYRAAKQLLDGGRLHAAREAFTAFVGDHPEHPLADNALYWLAETWYAQALWLRAARVFSQVVARYPAGNKVPDAMLKTGLCYENLGETRLARDTFAQLLGRYPGTHCAAIARRQLDRLGASGSPP